RHRIEHVHVGAALRERDDPLAKWRLALALDVDGETAARRVEDDRDRDLVAEPVELTLDAGDVRVERARRHRTEGRRRRAGPGIDLAPFGVEASPQRRE